MAMSEEESVDETNLYYSKLSMNTSCCFKCEDTLIKFKRGSDPLIKFKKGIGPGRYIDKLKQGDWARQIY